MIALLLIGVFLALFALPHYVRFMLHPVVTVRILYLDVFPISVCLIVYWFLRHG